MFRVGVFTQIVCALVVALAPLQAMAQAPQQNTRRYERLEGQAGNYGVEFEVVRRAGQEVAVTARSVRPGAIADRAGLRPHDRVLVVNGQPVGDIASDELPFMLVGSPLELVVRRDGQTHTVSMR